MIKLVIVLLTLAMIFSLTSGFVFLIKDAGDGGKKRTLYALGIRVTIAFLLVATITWAAYTGQIQIGAPWSGKY